MGKQRVGQVTLWTALIVGAALLIAIAVTTIFLSSEVNVPLLIAGSLLLVVPLIIDRLEGIDVGAKGLKLNLSKQIAELGSPKAAGVLEEAGLVEYASAYAFVYETLRDPKHRDARVLLLDRLIERAAATSRSRKLDADEVRRLFLTGPPIVRVLAVGLMEGDPTIPNAPVIRSVIMESQTGNEQYHGLKLAEQSWRRLDNDIRCEVKDYVQRDQHIQSDPDRKEIADRLIKLPADC